MMGDWSSGVSAMVRCAVWSERCLGVETLAIGRGGHDRADSCTLELAGAHLFYVVVIDGTFVFFFARSMDNVAPLDKLLTVGDGPQGWRTVTKLLTALEHSQITSLQPRPLELGEMDSNGFVIE